MRGVRWMIGGGLAFSLVDASRAGSEPRNFLAPSTAKMAERLETIARQVNPLENLWQSDLRARYFADKIAQTPEGRQRLPLQNQLAIELLNAGKTGEAIQAIQTLDEMLRRHNPEFARSSPNRLNLHLLLAIAYLRMGEQDNCLTNHTSESCLLPIGAGGVHRVERGSRAAIAELTGILQEFPAEQSARWLLNLAHMTVGEYPEKVPPRWLIPPKAFESDHDIKRFDEVAGELGLDTEELSGGVIMDDFDNDGDLDLITSSLGLRHQTRFFRNNGNGTFTDRTDESGLTGEVGGLNLVQADYNNDGFLDFLILRGAWMGRAGRHPNSLLRNNGNGTFTDVTEEAGLLRLHPTQTAAWFDYNGDGWLDLFVGNESTPGNRSRSELFRNNGDGTFAEANDLAGIRHYGFVKAVISGDFNNDGRPDLYLSQLGEPNVLFRNDGPIAPAQGPRGPWRFTDVAKSANATEPIDSFPAWFFDYDNDGWLDLFVAGFRFCTVGESAADYLDVPMAGVRPKLYKNNRDGTFADVTAAARLEKSLLTMGSNFGDLDNDGWLDLYLGTGNPDLGTLIPNRMFRNAEGRHFQDVTTSGGFGHLQKGHGVAFGDIDNDGDQDVFANMGGAFTGDVYRNALFQNPGHPHNWITLKLEGVKSNRSAIGARIKLIIETQEGDRAIYRTVGSGGSFGCSPLRQEIGLGSAMAIRTVEIQWPASGTIQTLNSLPMRRAYQIREDANKAIPWDLRSFTLKRSNNHSLHHQHAP